MQEASLPAMLASVGGIRSREDITESPPYNWSKEFLKAAACCGA
jgi:hypothetical protein